MRTHDLTEELVVLTDDTFSCHVFNPAGEVLEPTPNEDEALKHTWTAPHSLLRAVTQTPWADSPWMALQVAELENFRA